MTLFRRCLLVALAGAPTALFAQGDCVSTFDSVVAFTERNYLGYHLEITPTTRASYLERTQDARRAAQAAHASDCFLAVRRWVDGWEDGHLFLQEPLALDSAETQRRMGTVARRPVPTGEGIARLASVDDADLTGIWFDRGLRLAVVPAPRGQGWEAIVITPDSSTWQAGMVRAEITAGPRGGYEVRMRERNHAERRFAATLHRGTLLRMPPHIWGREAPTTPFEEGGLNPTDPRAPTIRAIGSAVVVAIPSHDPRFATPLKELLAAWHERILAAAPLVIDLRGNEGGSSATGMPLLAYANGNQLGAPVFPRWRPTVIASGEHLAWARSFVRPGEAPTPLIGKLIDRMAASPGEVVRYIDDADLPPETAWPAAAGGPVRIAVLTDRGTMSAGESLVAQLLRSPKVVTWGEATGGVLDYQMTRLLGMGVAPYRVILGYPTIGNHPELPKGGIRRNGFPPMRHMVAAGDAVLRAAIVGAP